MGKAPNIGRFISEDPARDDLNWYVYCASNPINFWDPLGLASVIFCANDEETKKQAEVRKQAYEEYYGTVCYVVPVNTAHDFVEEWNKWFADSDYLKDETIDAIEIISHGTAVGEGVQAVGLLYFSDTYEERNRLFARENYSLMGISDYSLDDLVSVSATGLYINACNGANPDFYNMTHGFMMQGNYTYITGWDGGVEWDWKSGEAIRGAGDYSPVKGRVLQGDPWFYVKKYQKTFWRYVNKDSNGNPTRKREGKRVFNRNPYGNYNEVD